VFDGASSQIPRYTDLELYSSGAPVAALNAFAGDFARMVVQATGGADRACSNATGSFRSVVCFNSGGAVALGCRCSGGFDGTVTLRNVTAVATGAGSRGIFLGAGLSAKLRIEGKNVIALGDAGDVRAESDSSMGVVASVALDYSNFDSATTDGGAGTSVSAVASGANQTAPPVFVDPANANFDQAPSSPTIDAGRDDGQLGSTDLDGDPRTLGPAPDIGEDEFVPPDTGTADAAAPETTITDAPKNKLKTRKKKAKAEWEFVSSEPGSTFQCSLDGGAFEPCSSPEIEKIKAKAKAKEHKFDVRAVDPAGNVDPTPASDELKVKRKKKKK
jgi:hypothetical protein